jgi:DNA polymerase-3 subunit beta
MNGQDFPNLPELYSEKGFKISSSIIKKMISKVSHSIAEQDNRPMLCGAFFNIKNDEIEMVSCDSFTLSKCNYKCEVGAINAVSSVEASFIMPGHALGELSKILGDSDDEVIFYLSRKHAIIKNGDIIFFTRTIDSEYIDYNKIMPKENDIFVTVDRERILDDLERANIVAEEKIKGSGRSYVKISANDQFLIITSSSINGKVTDEMDCVHEGKDIDIGFNCRYLINSIKVAEGENIKISLKSANMAITIEPVEEDDDFKYFYMILPVRMNDQV